MFFRAGPPLRTGPDVDTRPVFSTGGVRGSYAPRRFNTLLHIEVTEIWLCFPQPPRASSTKAQRRAEQRSNTAGRCGATPQGYLRGAWEALPSDTVRLWRAALSLAGALGAFPRVCSENGGHRCLRTPRSASRRGAAAWPASRRGPAGSAGACGPPAPESSPSGGSRHLVESEGTDRRLSASGGDGEAAPPGPLPLPGGLPGAPALLRARGASAKLLSRLLRSSLGTGSSAACAAWRSVRSRPRATDASSAPQRSSADSVLFLAGHLLRLLVGVSGGVPAAGLPEAPSSGLSAAAGVSPWSCHRGGSP